MFKSIFVGLIFVGDNFRKKLGITHLDELIFFSYNGLIRFAITKLKLLFPTLKVYLAEDGLASYLDNNKNKINFIKNLIYKLFLLGPYKNINELVDKYILFNKELYLASNKDHIKILKNYTKVCNKEKTLINHVFKYQNNSLIENYSFIFFDQPFSQQRIFDFNEREIINKIEQLLDKSTTLIILHPRQKNEIKKYYLDLGFYVVSDIFWELYLLNNKCSNKCLISFHSSTIINTKLLFEYHNYSIFLYNIWLKETQKINKFVCNYNSFFNEDKIKLPHNLVELQLYLENYQLKKDD